MIQSIRELALPGVKLISMATHKDSRGAFTELLRSSDAQAHSFGELVQYNYVTSSKGVVRGLHWQALPSVQAKAVTCLRGRIFDVVADVRSGSPTYRQWASVELDASNMQILVVPPGFAHGYLALQDDTAVLYGQTDIYRPELERAVRWDDPELAIAWPACTPVLSPKDAAAPALATLRG